MAQTITSRNYLLSADVLKATKSKKLSYYGVNYSQERKIAELTLTVEEELYGQPTSIRVSCEISLRITNYSSFMNDGRETINHDRISRIYFGDSTYGDVNHIKTFLKAIKKDSEVWFEAIIFNGNENLENAGFTNHKLYGCIGNNRYLLDSYVGPNNLASPVSYT